MRRKGNMNFLTTTIARILFSVPFIALGIGHLLNANMMAGAVPVPGGVIWIYITGIALILAGLSAITKFMGMQIMLMLALLLFVFIISIHLPAAMKPETMMMGMIGLYKDTGLMGGALLLAGIFNREKMKEQI